MSGSEVYETPTPRPHPWVQLSSGDFFEGVAAELEEAQTHHARMNSHHEAYAVILEELDEYWEEVRKRRAQRNPYRLWSELVQVAAMAARAAIECQPETSDVH